MDNKEKKIDGLSIRQVYSAEIFEQCARMMVRSTPWTTLQMTYDQCLTAFQGTCKEVFIMERDKEIVGFAILQMCGSFRGYIQTFFISESFRGQRLSRTLFEFCESRIRKVSPNIFLCVSAFNVRARDLYKKWGFVEVGVLNNFLKQGFDEVLMRKSYAPWWTP